MTRIEERKQDDKIARARTTGREYALKLLYLFDVRGKEDTDQEVDRLFSRESLVRESQDFARHLYEGVVVKKDELDQKIVEIAENWNIGRMAYIDRAVLRMGVYELLYCFDIPPKVTISEAIELAKSYSTEKSSAFVNGILDKIFQTCCPDKV